MQLVGLVSGGYHMVSGRCRMVPGRCHMVLGRCQMVLERSDGVRKVSDVVRKYPEYILKDSWRAQSIFKKTRSAPRVYFERLLAGGLYKNMETKE